jgi:hypothetical protein
LGRPLLRWTYDANGHRLTEMNELTTTTLSNTFDLNGRRAVQKADFTVSSVTTEDFQNEYGTTARIGSPR